MPPKVQHSSRSAPDSVELRLPQQEIGNLQGRQVVQQPFASDPTFRALPLSLLPRQQVAPPLVPNAVEIVRQPPIPNPPARPQPVDSRTQMEKLEAMNKEEKRWRAAQEESREALKKARISDNTPEAQDFIGAAVWNGALSAEVLFRDQTFSKKK